MTRSLGKYSFTFWLIFSIVIAYAAYNPYYSIADFMQLNVFWGLKVVVGGFFCGVLLLYITEGSKTLSPMGFLVLVAILGACVASLIHANWLSYGTVGYWIQIPVGISLALALRWGAIYRSITGRVAVSPDHDVSGGHHS